MILTKKHKRTAIALIATLSLIAVIFVGQKGFVLYKNLNPDFVNIKKDGFIPFFKFKTKKGTQVCIYCKEGKDSSFIELLMTRKGPLPFGLIAISAKYQTDTFWGRRLQTHPSNAGIYETIPDEYKISTSFGPIFMLSKRLLPNASVSFSITWNNRNSELNLIGISYYKCDELTIVRGEEGQWRQNIHEVRDSVYNLTIFEDNIKKYLLLHSFIFKRS